jgi:hypothetical protein
MSSRANLRFKQLSVGLMILIMGVILVNKAVYTHVHVLPDGSMTVHAHPFSKNSENNKNNSHQHSNLDILLLEMVNVLIFSTIIACTLKQFAQSAQFSPPAEEQLFPSLIPVSPGRAPPTRM